MEEVLATLLFVDQRPDANAALLPPHEPTPMHCACIKLHGKCNPRHSDDSSGPQPSPPHELALLCSRHAFKTRRKARRRNRERLDQRGFLF